MPSFNPYKGKGNWGNANRTYSAGSAATRKSGNG